MSRRAVGWVQVGLIGLAAIPILAGTARLVELLGGPEAIPTDTRFAASPAPVVVHVAASIGYALLGAFQFSASIRKRHPGWMTLTFPLKAGTGDLLYVMRLVVSSAMAISLILGIVAIRARQLARHRAWMMRAYALALGAGTQAFTVGFGEAIFGAGVVRRDLMMASGWVINLAVAEWLIRRTSTRRTRPSRTPGTLVGLR
jgi:Predicted membrane protein (DUF2306)